MVHQARKPLPEHCRPYLSSFVMSQIVHKAHTPPTIATQASSFKFRKVPDRSPGPYTCCQEPRRPRHSSFVRSQIAHQAHVPPAKAAQATSFKFRKNKIDHQARIPPARTPPASSYKRRKVSNRPPGTYTSCHSYAGLVFQVS
jgi:hypothetical protein